MTPGGLVLVALNLAALAWALAPVLRPSQLERRARALGLAARTADARDWRKQATHGAEHLSKALPAGLRIRAEAAANNAGWPEPAATWLIAATLALPLPVLLAALLAGAGPLPVLLLALLAAAGPTILAQNMALRRRAALAQGLPDALDLLVICAGTGLPIEAALTRTGRELAPARPAIAAELATTAIELVFLPRRADAFANLARRVPLPMMRALADTLIQTERFGTPLAAALQVMASEGRAARLLAAEVRAARLPALMTVPMIGFVLPPLFVILIGPAIIDALA